MHYFKKQICEVAVDDILQLRISGQIWIFHSNNNKIRFNFFRGGLSADINARDFTAIFQSKHTESIPSFTRQSISSDTDPNI